MACSRSSASQRCGPRGSCAPPPAPRAQRRQVAKHVRYRLLKLRPIGLQGSDARADAGPLAIGGQLPLLFIKHGQLTLQLGDPLLRGNLFRTRRDGCRNLGVRSRLSFLGRHIHALLCMGNDFPDGQCARLIPHTSPRSPVNPRLPIRPQSCANVSSNSWCTSQLIKRWSSPLSARRTGGRATHGAPIATGARHHRSTYGQPRAFAGARADMPSSQRHRAGMALLGGHFRPSCRKYASAGSLASGSS